MLKSNTKSLLSIRKMRRSGIAQTAKAFGKSKTAVRKEFADNLRYNRKKLGGREATKLVFKGYGKSYK